MSRTVVIAQARIDSARLPGKVLLEAGGMPVLAQVLRRAKAIPGIAAVCLATSDRNLDDPVAAVAAAEGVAVFRGSATDVLSRYQGAAELTDAGCIVRVTCDCPLLDPGVCHEVVALRNRTGADYASNVAPPEWPHGLDCEVFTRSALGAAAGAATDPYDREHVTPWIRRNPAFRIVNLPGPGGDTAAHRWTLDFPEDYAMVKAVSDAFAESATIPRWQEIVAFLDQHPEIAAMNAMRRDPSRSAAAKTSGG